MQQQEYAREQIPVRGKNVRAWYLLHEAQRQIYRATRTALKPLGISPEQANVLRKLKVADSVFTPSKLAHYELRERNSVSLLLSKMEKQGLIKKTNDLEGKNLVRISLTEKGAELCDIAEKKTRIAFEIFSCLSDEEYEQLTSLLQKIWDRGYEVCGIPARFDIIDVGEGP